ncbi:MAG: glycosyltransferase family 2 protein [Flavobacteriales bacterium]
MLIPTHNRKKELITAVASVLQQTIQDFEIFILDDASTEVLSEVVTHFDDTRIKLYSKEEKSNANVMRNIGLKLSNGRFIAFLDSDDEWLPNHLETQIDFLTKTSADGVFGSCFIENGVERKYAISRAIDRNTHPVNYLLSDGFAPIPSWVLKADCAKEIAFDETLKRHQDYDYFIRFYERFQWIANWEPSLIVNWQIGVVRNFDFESERSFITRYSSVIERRIFCQYCYTHFLYWKDLENEVASTFYKKLMLKHVDFITYNQFNQLHSTKTRWIYPLRWLNYSLLLLARHFRRRS